MELEFTIPLIELITPLSNIKLFVIVNEFSKCWVFVLFNTTLLSKLMVPSLVT